MTDELTAHTAAASTKIAETVQPLAEQFVAGWGHIPEPDFTLALENRCTAIEADMTARLAAKGQAFGGLDREFLRAFREAARAIWERVPATTPGGPAS